MPCQRDQHEHECRPRPACGVAPARRPLRVHHGTSRPALHREEDGSRASALLRRALHASRRRQPRTCNARKVRLSREPMLPAPGRYSGESSTPPRSWLAPGITNQELPQLAVFEAGRLLLCIDDRLMRKPRLHGDMGPLLRPPGVCRPDAMRAHVSSPRPCESDTRCMGLDTDPPRRRGVSLG
jgi:hypothetical protein